MLTFFPARRRREPIAFRVVHADSVIAFRLWEPGEDAPAGAWPAGRRGWMVSMEFRPSDERVAEWGRLAARGLIRLDPETGFPLPLDEPA